MLLHQKNLQRLSDAPKNIIKHKKLIFILFIVEIKEWYNSLQRMV
jgi:hypothetical protein